jgi:membrane-bound serine protease (ClpP class)
MSLFLADPNIAFTLLVLGALAISWELHAPGLVLPGAIGLLLLCVGAFGLYQDSPTWYGSTILAIAGLLLLLELKVYTHMISGIAGSLLLAVGTVFLFSGARHVDPSFAIAVSVAVGAITTFLGLLGWRARSSKHLTGIESMIGATGIARTPLDPTGTVFLRGEYWQARSESPVAVGKPVTVETVDDLQLFVKEA